MRVRRILENGGHAISKRVELLDAPAVGAIVQADRERRVADVELDADRGETVAYWVEDADDLVVQIDTTRRRPSPGSTR